MSWQPIETAPKDRRILLASKETSIQIAKWSDRFIDVTDNWKEKTGVWVIFDCDDPYYSLKYSDPEWWMELPTEP